METLKQAAVIVCRLQTPYIHAGHRNLIEHAMKENEVLLFVLGVSKGAFSERNALNFETRKIMIQHEYPQALIASIEDHCFDDAWSQILDDTIKRVLPNHNICLYGSRDSFLSNYKGAMRTNLFEPICTTCATDIREECVKEVKNSEDFRTGIIYAATHQIFPTSFQTVDIVIEHEDGKRILLGRKPGNKKWCFPGGFVDPSDISLEYAAQREAKEEVGDIEITQPHYIGSYRINDFRYRKSEHKIMSALFTVQYVYGCIAAGDDLEEVHWYPIARIKDNLVDEHVVLADAYLNNKQKTQQN